MVWTNLVMHVLNIARCSNDLGNVTYPPLEHYIPLTLIAILYLQHFNLGEYSLLQHSMSHQDEESQLINVSFMLICYEESVAI